MKIQLEQSEVVLAVREYVANQGIKVEGKTFAVNFSMTRGEAGLLADLVIDEPTVAPTKAVAKTRAGTVGAAIEKQADKGQTNVNKLPTSASEAVNQVKEKLAEDSGNTDNGEPAIAPEQEEVPADEAKEQPADTAEAVPAEQKTTTSLFG